MLMELEPSVSETENSFSEETCRLLKSNVYADIYILFFFNGSQELWRQIKEKQPVQI